MRAARVWTIAASLQKVRNMLDLKPTISFPIIRSFAIVLALSALLGPTQAVAAPPSCRETTFGACFTVHGRYNIYADGDAIWIIGTHRLLDAVDDNLDKMLENAGWEEHSIFGDFVVCPESQYKAGHKQSVCIQSYKDIRLGKWN